MVELGPFFQKVFENSVDGVLLTRPSGAVLRANAAACRALCRSEEEICRLGRLGLVVLDALHWARTGEAALTGGLTFHRPDGSTFAAEFTSGSLPPDAEGPLGWLIFRDVTVQQGLIRNEAMLRGMIDAIPHPIFLKDRDSRWLFANPAVMETVLDRPRDEVLGKDDLEIYPDQRIGAALMRADRAIVESGQAQTLEETVQTPGGYRVYLSTKAPFRDEEGHVIGVVGSAQDITGRKRVEDELRDREQLLRQSEARLNEAQRNAQVGSWQYLPGQPLVWSDQMFELFQLPAGRPPTPGEIRSRVHPEDASNAFDEILTRALRAGLPTFETECRVCWPDGQVRVQAWFGRIHRGSDGALLDVVGTVQDITERKREAAERERLLMAMGQTAEMVLVTDRSGAILYVNPAFERVTGYSSAEVLGQNPRLLQSGVQTPEFYRRFWETLSSGQSWRGRQVNRKKDGSHYTEDGTVSPARDASGAITSYVAVMRDVSREIELEAQLLQSQKMEGIGRLAGGVAHDFNNLLSVILTCSDLALGKLEAEHPLREELAEIERAGQRAASLTRQLLAFSRQQVLQPRELLLNQVLSEMEKMLTRIIGEDIGLGLNLAPDLGLVKTDAGQMEQVIMNLAVNARDAMPRGGRLSIQTANVELDTGAHVMIAVTDSGVGMDEKILARIFEPFFTTKPVGKGTGLGLSTAYGIIQQSGGHIDVRSQPGAGATFKVYLPRVWSSSPASEPRRGARGAGGIETVLVVEDDAAVRSIVRRMLQSDGYTVLAAASGPEALATCERFAGEIHLVLTDVVMPEMGGRVLVERLSEVRAGIKVLYMSGYMDETIGHHGSLEAGTQFIGKPLTQATLSKKIREVLDA